MLDPLSLVILAGSQFLKYQADADARDRRDSIRRAMEAYQRTKTRESQAATEGLLARETPKARGEELQQLTDDRARSMRDSVGAAQAFDVAPIAGKHSTDYAAARQAEAERVAERTRRAIEQLAAMGAPGEQNFKNGLRFGRAATTVDSANDAMDRVGRAYLTDIENVRADPMLSMLGNAGTAIGSSMLSRAGAVAAENAALDSGANNGQGYEDAAGNLYNEGVTTRPDVRIQRQLQRTFSLWGR